MDKNVEETNVEEQPKKEEKQRYVKIMHTNFNHDDQSLCIEKAGESIDSCKTPKDAARVLKELWDEKYPLHPWHCIIGKHFAASISFQSKKIIFFTIDQHNVMLYQTES